MTYYRMAMRVGNQGQDLWPQCFKLGVAAITYRPLENTDLSRHVYNEPLSLWRKLAPTQKVSLRRVAYEMTKGDVIFVKSGKEIVGRGIVAGPYSFDYLNRIIDEDGLQWPHQVPVEWDNGFVAVNVLLGAEQWAVLPLSQEDVKKIETKEGERLAKLDIIEAQEGEPFKAEADFRVRNRELINMKKRLSDCICEACGFLFSDFYGDIGRDYIIAHHLNPIASGSRKSTLDDIALVCANCHAMIHSRTPPVGLTDMKRIIAAHGDTRKNPNTTIS
jgi:hypothetical protein